MTDVTVRQFADVVGLPVERLLAQLDEAGLGISGADDTISDKEKMQLLSYLRKSHGRSESLSVSQPKKVTLKRKSHSELRTTASRGGGGKTVSVEVRKKRTYVKRADLVAEEEERLKQEAEEKAKVLAEREAKQEAEREALRRAEEEAARRAEEDRKRAEEELRESEKRYRTLAENSPVGIWDFTADGYTIYVNPAMCSMLEIESLEELAGRTYHSFFTPESLETMAREHTKCRKTFASGYEVEIVGKRGRNLNVLIYNAPLMPAMVN